MTDRLSASIIIPCKSIDGYVKECIEHCLSLRYENFEILVLPDSEQELAFNNSKVKVIPTGVVKPSEKRNVGIKYSNGEICAFIDSDAYPSEGWLKNAVKYFEDLEVAAVGGPGVTPATDDERQKASGLILSSRLGGGGLAHRYTPRNPKNDEDIPACNLIVRKSILEDLSGFNVNYWPGEDTYLSLQITNHIGMKMVYTPDVVVYHHRRPLFKQHLKQIWGYGLHRGYFVKRFPENSRKLVYFVPSIFVIGFIGGMLLSLLNSTLMMLYTGVLVLYFIACFLEGLKTRKPKMALLVLMGMTLTHLTYGLSFLKGLITRTLNQ